jgi:hypothetical protein
MDGDNEELLSFFNDSEFNFANSSRDSLPEAAELTTVQKNTMNLVLFGKEYEKDGSLCGFLKIVCCNGLKEGKIILRVVTKENLALKEDRDEQKEADNNIAYQLSLLRADNRRRSTTSLNEIRPSSIFTEGGLSKSSSSRRSSTFKNDIYSASSKFLKKRAKPIEFKVAQSTPATSIIEVSPGLGTSAYKPSHVPVSQISIFDDAMKDSGAVGPSSSAITRKQTFSVYTEMANQRLRNPISDQFPGAEDSKIMESDVGSNKVHPKSSTQKISTSSNPIYVYEMEIFSFDFAVPKETELILPFKISLDGKLIESMMLEFDWDRFADWSNKIRKKVLKSTIKSKLALITTGITPITARNSNAKSQSYSVNHFLEFYFLTNSGYKNYIKDTNPTSFGIFDGLKEYFKSSSDFLNSECSFSVYPLLRTLRQFNPITQDIIAQYHSKRILCFKWGDPMRCRLHIDKTTLGKDDSGITLLLHFQRHMLAYFCFLEVVLYCRFERKINLENPGYRSYILLKDSFDLESGLPPRPNTTIEEFVKHIELRTQLATFITINGPSCSISFYLKVFVSKSSGLYQNELLTQEIQFTSVMQDINISSIRFQTEAFRKVSKMVESANSKGKGKIIGLPFSEVFLSKPPELYEAKDEDEQI